MFAILTHCFSISFLTHTHKQVRWQTKPIERRSLYVPSKSNPQGVLEMWVDIMTPEVASAFPPDDVSLPPTQMFEVRVVIWKTKNVPAMDSLEGMSDLFVKCWPEGMHLCLCIVFNKFCVYFDVSLVKE